MKASFSRIKKDVIIFVFLFVSIIGYGQNENPLVKDSVFNMSEEKISWDLAFAFKTQNYFRGLLVSESPSFSTQEIGRAHV